MKHYLTFSLLRILVSIFNCKIVSIPLYTCNFVTAFSVFVMVYILSLVVFFSMFGCFVIYLFSFIQSMHFNFLFIKFFLGKSLQCTAMQDLVADSAKILNI